MLCFLSMIFSDWRGCVRIGLLLWGCCRFHCLRPKGGAATVFCLARLFRRSLDPFGVYQKWQLSTCREVGPKISGGYGRAQQIRIQAL